MEPAGDERQASRWMPPLEARELGSAAPGRPGKRFPVGIALIAAAGAVVALFAIGKVIAAAEGPRDGSLESVVHGFVDARAARDAARACDALTERARRDMVALVRGVEPVQASATDCERYVLLSSERSEFTDPALPGFRGHDLTVRHFARAYGRDYAVVKPAGLSHPFLELRKVNGEWKLDGLAAERVSFVAGCNDHGAPLGYCECLFDTIAEHGHAAELDEVATAARTGEVPAFFRDAAAGCAPRRRADR